MPLPVFTGTFLGPWAGSLATTFVSLPGLSAAFSVACPVVVAAFFVAWPVVTAPFLVSAPVLSAAFSVPCAVLVATFLVSWPVSSAPFFTSVAASCVRATGTELSNIAARIVLNCIFILAPKIGFGERRLEYASRRILCQENLISLGRIFLNYSIKRSRSLTR